MQVGHETQERLEKAGEMGPEGPEKAGEMGPEGPEMAGEMGPEGLEATGENGAGRSGRGRRGEGTPGRRDTGDGWNSGMKGRKGFGGTGIKCELYHDSFQNWKSYPIQKAQLIIADIPYNLGDMAYGSNPMWYVGGDNKNGESEKAKSSFFTSDGYFRISEYFFFCNRLLKPEPKGPGAPCMIVFCAWQQQADVIRWAADAGFGKYIPLVFIKNYSPQVLKANMKIVGATEYAIVLYRDRLPKFNNGGNMIFNWMPWDRDGKEIPKIHPTQKPVRLLKRLIDIFTDPGDVVIDPVAGSGSTLRAAVEMRRNAYGFEIDRNFYREAKEKMLNEAAFTQVSLLDVERVWKQEQLTLL